MIRKTVYFFSIVITGGVLLFLVAADEKPNFGSLRFSAKERALTFFDPSSGMIYEYAPENGGLRQSWRLVKLGEALEIIKEMPSPFEIKEPEEEKGGKENDTETEDENRPEEEQNENK